MIARHVDVFNGFDLGDPHDFFVIGAVKAQRLAIVDERSPTPASDRVATGEGVREGKEGTTVADIESEFLLNFADEGVFHALAELDVPPGR